MGQISHWRYLKTRTGGDLMQGLFSFIFYILIFILLGYGILKNLYKIIKRASILKVHQGLPSLEKLTSKLTKKK